MPTWDRHFVIDGLTISGIPFPDKRMEINNNMVLTRVEGKPERCVARIRVKTKEKERIFASEGAKGAKNRILDFVCIYALRTYHEPTIQDAGASKVEEADRLGEAEGGIMIRVKTTYPEGKKKEHIEKESRQLAKAVEYFKSSEMLFISNSWLRNALRYFYFARINERLEDKLINLIISMESMFFGKEERGELRYRLSLRAATLIGNVFDDKISQVFLDIKKLYDKRCDVVHGQVTKVTHNDINRLETYTKRAIESFVLMLYSRSKEDILRLLDRCLVNKESVVELREFTCREK